MDQEKQPEPEKQQEKSKKSQAKKKQQEKKDVDESNPWNFLQESSITQTKKPDTDGNFVSLDEIMTS